MNPFKQKIHDADYWKENYQILLDECVRLNKELALVRSQTQKVLKEVSIESPDDLQTLIDSGFVVKQLDITVNNLAKESPHNPLNRTLLDLVGDAERSNSQILKGSFTLTDAEKPEVMYFVAIGEDLVEKIWNLMETIEDA